MSLVIIRAILGLLVSIAASVLWLTIAGAHDPYPYSCCHDQDCKPVPSHLVRRDKDGAWHVQEGEAHYTFPPSMVREPLDDQFHRCVNPYLGELCFFPAQGGV